MAPSTFIYEAALTPKALEQLNLWPSDNERGLYLLSKLADAFTAAAAHLEDDGDQEAANRLPRGRADVEVRTAARSARK